jgi:hypothetical protein
MPEPTRAILLVGHCTPDAYAIRAALGSMVPEATVAFVNSDADLKRADGASLLLINRELDGDFAADDGLNLIAQLAGTGARTMLVSNHADAQGAAQEAGAALGFGKRDLYSPEMRRRVRAALGLP